MKKEKFIQVVARIFKSYQALGELSPFMLVFILYLIDWKSTLIKGKQLSDIKWKYIDESFANDTIEKINNRIFKDGVFDHRKVKINLKKEDIAIIDELVNKSLNLDSEKFIKLVFSTYPMYKEVKGINLDLSVLAKEYTEDYKFIEK